MENIYAIKNPSGLYYRGSCYGDERDWTENPCEIFSYTKEFAEYRIKQYPAMFSDCEAVKPIF